MAYENNENNEKKMESVYSKRIRAGKRRTYFFDVRETRGNDYYLTITESRKRFDSDGYDRHKIFLYKEDFNKFIKGLGEAIDYVKTDLMPDFDFDAFNHDNAFEGEGGQQNTSITTDSAEPAVIEEKEAPVEEQPKDTGKIETIVNDTDTTENTADNGSDEVAEKW